MPGVDDGYTRTEVAGRRDLMLRSEDVVLACEDPLRERQSEVGPVGGATGELSPATAEVFAAADVYSTAEGLPARWRTNARWQAELSSINAIDQFETGNGAKLFPRVGDANPVLLRRPLVENSSVAAHSAINPAATADNPILLYGDWSQYVILDRIGATVEYIPHLLSTTTNLPDGRRGLHMFWRTGADVLTTNAFVVMNIATTA